MDCVGKIQDRVEQLEVARAVAEGFKVPESLIFERLKVSPRKPNLRPIVPPQQAVQPARRLSDSEKQLIHGLLQDSEQCRVVEPLLETGFLLDAWSRPVLEQLIRNPNRSIHLILDSLEDDELRTAVRAAVFEPFGSITARHVLASVAQLYDAHLVKQEKDIREQLRECGARAPVELLRKQERIAIEKSRMRGLKP
jgi:hypothetical protein